MRGGNSRKQGWGEPLGEVPQHLGAEVKKGTLFREHWELLKGFRPMGNGPVLCFRSSVCKLQPVG